MEAVLRFAPSPNGRLHLGHAYSALLNADLAQRWGGYWLLRIEDIDPARCRPEYERGIGEDLRWLGLCWPEPVRRQSEHMPEYRKAFEQLRTSSLVYPCFCSRADVLAAVKKHGPDWPRDPDGAPLYPGTCRQLPDAVVKDRLAQGHPHGWRLDSALATAALSGALDYVAVALDGAETCRPADPSRWGDAIIVRKDTPTSYHLSVVADDAVQGISHVVRGQDLEAATDLHVLLQGLLGLPRPRYHHHRLLRDEEGQKLSKSARSKTLAELRAAGVTPQELRDALGFS